MRTHSYDASYQMIRDCVRERFGLCVQTCSIADMKQKSLRLFSPSRQRV